MFKMFLFHLYQPFFYSAIFTVHLWVSMPCRWVVSEGSLPLPLWWACSHSSYIWIITIVGVVSPSGIWTWVFRINTCVKIVPSTLPLDHHGRIFINILLYNFYQNFNELVTDWRVRLLPEWLWCSNEVYQPKKWGLAGQKVIYTLTKTEWNNKKALN